MREAELLAGIPPRIAELLGLPPERIISETNVRKHGSEVDAVIKAAPYAFVVELKGVGDVPSVARAIQHLGRIAGDYPGCIPLIVVPFMRPAARGFCKEAGMAWLDLSGNADVTGPGLRLLVIGNPDRFVHPGRPSSVFAPKSARVARTLLMSDHPLRQRELAAQAGIGPGFVSRTVGHLIEAGLAASNADKEIFLPDRALVLDAWREAYDFGKHEILRVGAAARSGDELLRRLARLFSDAGISYAATGLGAAWLQTRHAGFRTVTFYLEAPLDAAKRRDFSLHDDISDANVWLVLPNDAGVFHGAGEHEGIRCVHPIQAWLDLKGHGERAPDAAAALRPMLLRAGSK